MVFALKEGITSTCKCSKLYLFSQPKLMAKALLYLLKKEVSCELPLPPDVRGGTERSSGQDCELADKKLSGAIFCRTGTHLARGKTKRELQNKFRVFFAGNELVLSTTSC